MKISGLNKLTLLDYPKHTACTVFLPGCNFTCPFCHNASLVLRPGTQPEITREELFAFLNKRKTILEGVCITGGEPTLQRDLPDLIRDIKALGFDVKLDTNGTNPDMLEALFDKGLVDYVAMDVKNSADLYAMTVGWEKVDVATIQRSIDLIMARAKDYEFRTTVMPELHTKESIARMGEMIKGAKRAFLQAYRVSDDVISPTFSEPDEAFMQSLKTVLSEFAEEVGVRGV